MSFVVQKLSPLPDLERSWLPDGLETVVNLLSAYSKEILSSHVFDQPALTPYHRILCMMLSGYFEIVDKTSLVTKAL